MSIPPPYAAESPSVTVAVAQIASTFDIETTLAKIFAFLEDAAKNSAQLIVFPEATIGGYPKHHTFGTAVGERTPEGRVLFEKYANGAISVPGPEIDKLAQKARTVRIFIVIGVIEKSKESGTLFCTAVYIDPEKGYMGKHRKVMPTGSERLIWGQGDGSTLGVYQPSNIPGAVVSATICWENYMPLLRYHYYSKNVNIYCAPTVDSRDTWPITMQHIAFEGRTFVLSACQFARKRDFPGMWKRDEKEDEEEEIIKGGSMIVNPMGEVLSGPVRGRAGLILGKLDLGECVRGKFDLDVVGHYARYLPSLLSTKDSAPTYSRCLSMHTRPVSRIYLFRCSFSSKINSIKTSFGKNEKSSRWTKHQVATSWFSKSNLPNQSSGGIPYLLLADVESEKYMDTIAATRINVSRCITLDPVGESLVAMSKYPSVLQNPRARFTKSTDVKNVSELTWNELRAYIVAGFVAHSKV